MPPTPQNFTADQAIPYFGKGRSPILSRNHDPIVTFLNALKHITIKRVEATANDTVDYSSSGITLNIGKEGFGDTSDPTDISFKRAKITAVHADYVEVAQWDNDDEDFTGGAANVAKPPNFRSDYAGETAHSIVITYDNYSADGNERDATYDDHDALTATTAQRVYPPYRVDDEIYFVETTQLVGVSTYTRIEALPWRAWHTETQGCDGEGDPIYTFAARSPWRTTAVGSDFA